MASIRERRPGVWEIQAFAGRDKNVKPIQSSRTVRGTKKDAQRLAAEMTLRPTSSGANRITVAHMLDLWAEKETASWSPSTTSNQLSRIRLIKADRIGSIVLPRLSAVDVDHWHSRLAKRGVGEGSVRNQHQA